MNLIELIEKNAPMNVNHLFDCVQKCCESIIAEQLEKLTNRRPRVREVVITTEDGYFEKSKI